MLRIVLVATVFLYSCTQGELIGHSCSISCPGNIDEAERKGCNCDALADELDSVKASLHKLTSIVLVGWKKASNDRWYRLFLQPETFRRATEICKQHGAILASAGMRNLTVKSEIINLFGSDNIVDVWIGLSDMKTEGSWVWEDGSTEPTDNWARGQPDNESDSEHCVQMRRHRKFNDVNCGKPIQFLCETDTIM